MGEQGCCPDVILPQLLWQEKLVEFVGITANQVSFQGGREFNKIMMILGVITDAKGTMPDSQGRQVIRPVCTHRPTLHAFQGLASQCKGHTCICSRLYSSYLEYGL